MEYASQDSFKRPCRRDMSCKIPSYCPYPVCTRQPSVDYMHPVFLEHASSLPSMSSSRMLSPPVASKSFSPPSFLEPNPEIFDDCQVPFILSPRCITLSDLKFEKLIGTGMYSKVYLVQSIKSRAYFALKVMPKNLAKKTKSEAEVMRSIDHPFIVKLWNSFEDEENLYMVMEFAAGGELFYHLRERGKFDEHTARFYAAEVIMALEYLHSSGIVFRDLKLENLVLSATGHIKLTDFGFAKNLEDTGRAFTLCGTPEYLAPEIIRGTGYNYSVDWWALGVLLFEMLSGYSPFYSSSPLEIYKNVLSGRIRFPSEMDPVAKDLLKGLLARDPRKRLGVVRNGMSGIRLHPFFNGIQWTASTIPPIVPVLSHPGDTAYFKIDEDGAGNVSDDDAVQKEIAKFPDF